MTQLQQPIKIIECPRDAMQGIKEFIPTTLKIEYLNKLLEVGFDVLDFGSFVSSKAIPQLQDTSEVLKGLNLSNSNSKLLAIIANLKGAETASQFNQIRYLGFPFSVSETFQRRNTNASIDESFIRVEEIQNTCLKHNKTLIVYLSMAFGNPYGDPWHEDIVTNWALKLKNKLNVNIISLADTIGVSTPNSISQLFNTISPELSSKNVQIGAHLHTLPTAWEEKMEALVSVGCNWIDGAIKGLGGCPMAKDELTGNMPTEKMIQFLQEKKYDLTINKDKLEEAIIFAAKVFHL